MIIESIASLDWWTEEAARRGSDWPGVLDGARTLSAVAVGEVTLMDDFDRLCREADRKAAAHRKNSKLERLRDLMADDVSFERAWHELCDRRPAPEATIKALMFSLRRGANELAKPDTQRRLSALDRDQLKDVCRRVQAFQPAIAKPWSADEVTALISAWRKPP